MEQMELQRRRTRVVTSGGFNRRSSTWSEFCCRRVALSDSDDSLRLPAQNSSINYAALQTL